MDSMIDHRNVIEIYFGGSANDLISVNDALQRSVEQYCTR
jgi:hypothetical protein